MSLNDQLASLEDEFFESIISDDVESVRSLLIENPWLKSSRSHNGHTGLALAASAGNTSTVAFLLANGVSPNVRDQRSDTPLHVCRDGFSNAIPCMFLLKDAGARINSKNRELNTPLMEACLFTNLWAVSFLLSKGARVDCKNRDQLDAFDLVTGSLESALKQKKKFADQIDQARLILELLNIRKGQTNRT